jgi:transcriptional regulator with XRE-family HTH domain
MTPRAIKALREHLHLTQEVFASILGVSFATVNRWENGKTTPTGDYARVLQTLGHLTAPDAPGAAIDWRRVGALSAMAAVAGFSPLLTLGAALAPVLIAHLPSWADVPGGEGALRTLRPSPQVTDTERGVRRAQPPAWSTPRRKHPKAAPPRSKPVKSTTHMQRAGE